MREAVAALDLRVDPVRFRRPVSHTDVPWELTPTFEPWLDRLHFLVWANTYDARGNPLNEDDYRAIVGETFADEADRQAFEQALAIDERAFGLEHPNVARDVNNLGLVLRDLGDLGGAALAGEHGIGRRLGGGHRARDEDQQSGQDQARRHVSSPQPERKVATAASRSIR